MSNERLKELQDLANRAGWVFDPNYKSHGNTCPAWVKSSSTMSTYVSVREDDMEWLEKHFGHGIACATCNRIIYNGYYDSPQRLKNRICFTCKFFLDISKTSNHFVVENEDGLQCYSMGDNNAKFAGFGGDMFVIIDMDTNELSYCNNLSFRGHVPDHLRHLFTKRCYISSDRQLLPGLGGRFDKIFRQR